MKSAPPLTPLSPNTPLAQIPFVVVDCETTGHDPQFASLTEIAAVRMLADQQLDQFTALVATDQPITAFITGLTGITAELLVGAPPIAQVLPRFLEFATGGVLVAHHAPFDLGFLRAASAKTGVQWPDFLVIDTAQLSRNLLHPGETSDHKLSTLASHFGVPNRPTHRALPDALATASVLTHLCERLQTQGGRTLADLVQSCRRR